MFDKTEQVYVDLVADCESWDDVVEISKMLQMAYTEELTTSQDHLSFGMASPDQEDMNWYW